MCGITTGNKNEVAKRKRDGKRSLVEEPRYRTAKEGAEVDHRADGEEPRVAKRPPGRLPKR